MISIPAVSVVITTFNIENYILPCVQSVLKQTFQDFEIVLIDDCSTDHTWQICQQLATSNEKIRAFQRESNGGAGASRNTGLINARGKYIYFVDGDDLILPNALEVLFNTAEKNNADIVHTMNFYQTTVEKIRSGSNEFMIYHDRDMTEGFLTSNIVERVMYNWVYGHTQLMIWLNFYNREFLISNEIRFPEILAEDMFFSFTDVAFANRYLKISRPLYIHVIRQGSLAHGIPNAKVDYSKSMKGITSLIECTKYFEKILLKLPVFRDDEKLRDFIINFALMRYSYVSPNKNYTSDRKIIGEYYKVISKGFDDIFHENSHFVKWFFNHFNFLFVENYELKEKISALENKLAEYKGGGVFNSCLSLVA